MISPDQIGAYIFAVIGGGVAWFERSRSVKQRDKLDLCSEAVSDAKKHQERADLMGKLADDYKHRFEVEHKEFNDYRDYAHNKGNKDQETLLKFQEKVNELQARPDFSDLFEHLKQQSDISVKILDGMGKVLEAIKELLAREQRTHI